MNKKQALFIVAVVFSLLQLFALYLCITFETNFLEALLATTALCGISTGFAVVIIIFLFGLFAVYNELADKKDKGE